VSQQELNIRLPLVLEVLAQHLIHLKDQTETIPYLMGLLRLLVVLGQVTLVQRLETVIQEVPAVAAMVAMGHIMEEQETLLLLLRLKAIMAGILLMAALILVVEVVGLVLLVQMAAVLGLAQVGTELHQALQVVV
jgi:hypothetical protein